tara:strand:- start:71 stop:1078 length:1008 start_codon:yes stop_codon:yes gene_type:complete
MIRLFSILCVISFWFGLSAQDIHFSQYYASPFNLNPALTGLFDGSIRAWANYRSQWGTVHVPYETYDAALDFTLPVQSDNMGLGLYFLQDASGSSGLRVSKVALMGAYQKGFGPKKHRSILALGYYAKYVQKGIAYFNLTFPNQYNGNFDFDPNLNSGENSLGNSLYYLDFGLGSLLRLNMENFPVSTIGFAFYHVNLPKESFLDSENRLGLRYHIHGDSRLALVDKGFLTFRGAFMGQNNNHEALMGLEYEHFFNLSPRVRRSIFVGLMTRLSDAIIIVAGGEHKNVRLGLSYDVNISSLKPASNMYGALELSMQYVGIFKKFTGIKCPPVPRF